MTWFGIILAIYYVLNTVTSAYYAGNGGYRATTGGLVLSAAISIAFLGAILFVGTGTGVL